MSSSDLAALAAQVAAATDAVLASPDAAVAPEALQSLFASAVKLYAREHDAGRRFRPLPEHNDISATAVLVATGALLKSANLEIFELGMWQSWSGTR